MDATSLRRSLAVRIRRRTVAPEQLVWIFGFARSGTTWLARMLSGIGGNELWNEPLVGVLFGDFYERENGDERRADFIMSPKHRDAWLSGIRHLVLEGATARCPNLPAGGSVIVKEPNGSLGAPFLSAALPEARIVFMIRDPRDIVASLLDAQGVGGWTADLAVRSESSATLAQTDPDAFVRETSEYYRRVIERVTDAYESHPGPKTTLSYEDLRAHPVDELRRACGSLEVPTNDDELRKAVDRAAWQRIPETQKGDGKFFRKATPGAWTDDLTPGQARIVEEVTAPVSGDRFSNLEAR
ncbi:MAG: hypothetical protein QOI10_2584 [Solirubrobacterales bacterium]|jgi:hypothetical protein|nr:hypothetical protein [Solirubrobacterales bacterium]